MLVLSSVDPAGYFKFGEAILNRELVFGLQLLPMAKPSVREKFGGKGAEIHRVGQELWLALKM